MNIGHMTRRFSGRGWDKLELGRWAWSRYKCKKDRHIRIVVVYCPTRNEGNGQSVHSQQRSIMLDSDYDRCPRKAFFEDLWT